MGLELTVVPIKNGEHDKWWLGYNRLRLDSNYDLFALITPNPWREGVKPLLTPQLLPLGVRFDWYDDGGLKTETKDCYSDMLTYVCAREFLKINIAVGEWNHSVLSFLCFLPPTTPVVLWWH